MINHHYRSIKGGDWCQAAIPDVQCSAWHTENATCCDIYDNRPCLHNLMNNDVYNKPYLAKLEGTLEAGGQLYRFD